MIQFTRRKESEKQKPPLNLPEGRLIAERDGTKKKQGSRDGIRRFVSLVMMIMNAEI